MPADYFGDLVEYSACLTGHLSAAATSLPVSAEDGMRLCDTACAPFDMTLNYRDCIIETVRVVCENGVPSIIRGECPSKFPTGTKLEFVWSEHNILLAQEANMPNFISGKLTSLLTIDGLQMSTDQPDISTNVTAGSNYLLTLRSGSKEEKVFVHSTVMGDLIVMRGVNGTSPCEWPVGTCFTTHSIIKDDTETECPPKEEDGKTKASDICVGITDTKGFSLDFGEGTLQEVIAALFCALADVRDNAGVDKAVVTACVQEAIGGLELGVSKTVVTECITQALLDYYTRTQVNDIVSNIQDAIASLVVRIVALEACVAELKAEPVFVAPTGEWADVLDGSCPAISTATVANPEGVNLCVTSTGTADIEVKVGGTLVPDTTDFSVPDGDDVEISVSHPTDNIVGGISIFYIDNNGAKQLIDVFQYDAACAATAPPLTGGSLSSKAFDEGVGGSCPSASCFTGGVNPITYSLFSVVPVNAGITITASGDIVFAPTVSPDNYTITVEAEDASGTTASCDIMVVVNAVSSSGMVEAINPANCMLDVLDLNGDIQNTRDCDILNTETGALTCGSVTLTGINLHRKTHSNGSPTEYELQLFGTGTISDLVDLVFTSGAGFPTVVPVTSTTIILTQTQYDAINNHITQTDGYEVTANC